MSGSFMGSGFGGDMGGFNLGKSGSSIMDAMEQLRATFEQKVGTRMGRGDVRAAVLALLTEQPMHGYQIISEIAERSHGAWKPSAGSVYPTLQLLADEGLIVASESNGRKTYTLTDAGRTVAEAAGNSAPWESTGAGQSAPRDHSSMTALPKSGMELAQAAAQVGRTGTPEQVKQAVSVLDDARRKLYSILAQD
ncbi:PadR family transcriptional regulator [Microbacterium lacus]|uniref:PadR family transcriptional regulator n=1 Tax=Microbacterium lacus TaxID=415217 RepID=UPI0038513BC7